MTGSKGCWQPPEDWSQWSQWLAAGLHARNRWRLPVLLMGMLFAQGRRTVTAWLRAAGVSPDYQDYYYFLAALGRKTHAVATQLLVLRTVPLPDRLLAVRPSMARTGSAWSSVPPIGKADRSPTARFTTTDPHSTAVEIIETIADRATIEQDFHDVKEVWGAGQQQVRNIWANVAVYHLNLWIHTLLELWAWNRPHDELCDRRLSPWDDANRRPSHADRRKTLRRYILEQELSILAATRRLPQKILRLAQRLMALAS